jgi:hypothetical protein
VQFHTILKTPDSAVLGIACNLECCDRLERGHDSSGYAVDMQMHLDYAGAHKIGADDPPKHGLIAIGSLPRAFLFAARSGAN